MISSLDDAIPFLNKWEKDKTPLDVVFTAEGITFNGTVFVSPRSNREVLELFAGDEDSPLSILRLMDLSLCSFDFLTPLEGEELRPKLESLGLEICWEIKSPRGYSLALYERRL
jgi:hypothetical protein